MRKSPELPKTITARPLGEAFAVVTHDLHHRQGVINSTGEAVKADLSDNFISRGNGCYRRMPTNHEE